MNPLVFISHNSIDKEIARNIGLFLTSEDISVWFDEWKIPFGESIPEFINKGLEACTHYLLVWSKNSANSQWVNRELQSIIYKSINKNLKIIPIILDDTPLPLLIADKLSIYYEEGNESDRYKIIKAITGESPSNNYIEAIVKKYNEVIYDYNSDDIFLYKACPNCGKSNFEYKQYADYEGDELYYFIRCKECSWSDWTQ